MPRRSKLEPLQGSHRQRCEVFGGFDKLEGCRFGLASKTNKCWHDVFGTIVASHKIEIEVLVRQSQMKE